MKVIKFYLSLLGVVSLLAGCGSGSDDNWQHPTEVKQTEKSLEFPSDFIWSSGTSHLQHDGTAWKQGRGMSHLGMFGQSFSYGETVDVVNDLGSHWKEDIQDMKKAGLQAYRFSLDWAWIVPTGFPIQMDMTTGQPVLDENGNTISAVNQVAIDWYNAYIDELVANGIKPTVTLYHYDMPMTLAFMGSFKNRQVAEMWLAFTQIAFANFGDRVTHWYTFNEVINGVMLDGIMSTILDLIASGGQISGDLGNLLASKSKSDMIGENLDFIHNVMWAHARAMGMAKQMQIKGKVGFINTFIVPKVAGNDPRDVEAARIYSLLNNDMLTMPINEAKYPQEVMDLLAEEGYSISYPAEQVAQELQFIQQMGTDFAAINYYGREIVSHSEVSPFGDDQQFELLEQSVLGVYNATPSNDSTPAFALSDGYDPQGLYETLMWMSDNLPAGTDLIISENGAGTKPDNGNLLLSGVEDRLTDDGNVHDPKRIDFIKGHISAVHKAIQDGANVTMYSAWSLWDLWEFTRFNNVFGLIYVDYDDPARTRYKKDSFYWYSDVIKTNTLKLGQNHNLIHQVEQEMKLEN